MACSDSGHDFGDCLQLFLPQGYVCREPQAPIILAKILRCGPMGSQGGAALAPPALQGVPGTGGLIGLSQTLDHPLSGMSAGGGISRRSLPGPV